MAATRNTKSEPHCSVCNIRLKPTFKPTRWPDDWTYLDCDECCDFVCPACSMTDEDGHTICDDCYAGHAMKAERCYGVFLTAGRGMRRIDTIYAKDIPSAWIQAIAKHGEDIQVYRI